MGTFDYNKVKNPEYFKERRISPLLYFSDLIHGYYNLEYSSVFGNATAGLTTCCFSGQQYYDNYRFYDF